MNKSIRIVRGTDFTVRVTVYHKPLPRPRPGFRPEPGPEEGKVTADGQIVDLSTCTDLHVDIYNKLGNRTHKAFTLDESRLLIDFDEQTPSGTYGLEVTGKYASGADWRFTIAPGDFVVIVESSDNADTPSADNIYDFTAVSLTETVSAASIQALKDATDAANSAAEKSSAATSEFSEAESIRQANEENRKNAENVRISNESDRISSEQGRVSAESARVANETARQAAETVRDTNEKDRESKPYCLYDEIEDADEINNANYTEVKL